MKTSNALPGVVGLCATAWAQAEAGDTAGARRTADLALEAATNIANEYKRELSLALVAGAQARAGDTAGALRTAESIAHYSYDERADAFMLAARASALAGNATGAREIAGLLLDRATTVTDHNESTAILRAAAAALAAAGDVAGALTLASNFPDQDMAFLVSAIRAELGDFAGAVEAAKLMPVD